MGAAALLVQVLIPLVLVADMKALSSGAGEHAHHQASVQHLRSSPSVSSPSVSSDGKDHPAAHDGGSHEGGSHDSRGHIGCPLCLALHAANGILAATSAVLPPLPLGLGEAIAANAQPAPGQPCPAAYSPRAPPHLA